MRARTTVATEAATTGVVEASAAISVGTSSRTLVTASAKTFASGLRGEAQLTKDLAVFEECGRGLIITVDLIYLAGEYTEDSSIIGSILSGEKFLSHFKLQNRVSQDPALTGGKGTKLA